MERLPDWPSRLNGTIEAARARPFRWGSHDCALFACEAVEAMTGVDPGAWFRGRYGGARAARLALRRFAGGGLQETVERLVARLDMQEVTPMTAQRGDLVLGRGPRGGLEALGICVGNWALFATPRGLLPVERRYWQRAWRV